jgi:transcriptional regulator with XRE-family HTH domain
MAMLPFEDRSDLLAAVGERLISERVRLGFDLEFAATLAHVEAERLAAAEDGVLALGEDELQALADVYGVDVPAFFGGRVTPFSYLAGA